MRDLQHFGEEGGVVPVIDVASTSTFLDPLDMVKTFKGEMQGCYLYSRHSNPTVQMFSAKMAALEGTEAALGVASGMAAISATLFQLLEAGDHMICHSVVYGGTYALLHNRMPKHGVDVSFDNFSDMESLEKRIQKNTKVLYVETLSNPTLRVAPFEKIKALKKKYPHVTIIVDNTFAPSLINPIDWGADIVVHSCTKFISGASDMIAGCVCGSQEFIDSLIDVNHGSVMLNGPVMDPKVAHELYLRLDHLPIRMRGHSENAMHFATLAEELGIPTQYPGLKSHPQHADFAKYFDTGIGHGGMVTIDLGTADRALHLAKGLQDRKFGLYAVSLGFSRTLLSCPSVSTSSEIPEEEQKQIDLHPGLLRLSIGYTGDRDTMSERFKEAYQEL